MPKISLKSKKFFLIILFSLILVICLVVANFFSTFLIKTESASSSASVPFFSINFLSLSKSQVKNEVLATCQDYQKIGAGGFVWQNDNYYYCLSSGYLNKNDAVLVQNSLSTDNIKSEILTVKFKEYSIYGNFDNDEIKILNKALLSPLNFYKEMYDIAISLDTSVYNEISARMAVNNVHNNLCATIENFLLLFKNNTENSIISITNLLQKTKDVSTKLCSGMLLNNNQTYSSLLKYRYIEVLRLYYDFLNK